MTFFEQLFGYATAFFVFAGYCLVAVAGLLFPFFAPFIIMAAIVLFPVAVVYRAFNRRQQWAP